MVCSESPARSPPPINDNWLCRYSTLLAIRALRSFRPYKGSVMMLTDRLCVKYGAHVHMAEALALLFSAFTHGDFTYIVMERIKGEMIATGWVPRSEDSKSKLLAQLRQMAQEMRQLKPPEGMGIASVDGGSLVDPRFRGAVRRVGPFSTIQDFHRHLREGLEWDSRLDPEAQGLIKQHENNWPLVFTHGDLSSLNVLARGDQIVGIIDWETAGWFPFYWEYTTACQVNPQNSFWIEEIDRLLTPMPEELAMEQLRQKYFGAF
ncbi:kinase-like protein [Aspergillus homomorphus CBS 101889]|uniref:Kinase-like protein n=1 Tax=Aspergillus homomorphus (strain CBS 101889) TaxID=1450537 RepID=A0A395IDX5_ASPHC|nr:kinase-like protein [Aspergillus homomorphus CBS 101889]RAL17363.1 kinase-like protein [Aspergillus homomorphus CBS 101889]